MSVPSFPAFLSSATMLPSSRSFSTQKHDIEAQKCEDKLVLEWDDISYAIQDKTILRAVSGCVAAGEMLAVMGPSGAGKSTILDVLAKRSKLSGGTITVNGDAGADMSTLASYVEQDDALLGVLTVRETLQYAARLSLFGLPPSTISQRVDTMLAELGLTDVAHQRIGNAVQRGISGGQKRRVTLGAALVTMPKILLLDEPTSGLDSRASREVIQAVKTIAARHNMIVVASIHQPNWETVALFDKLLLLAQGRTMYFGPIDYLSDYLSDHLSHPVPTHANPTDHALDVVSTDFIKDPTRREQHVGELANRWMTYERSHPELCGFMTKSADEHEHDMELETNQSGAGSEGHSLRVFLNSSDKTNVPGPSNGANLKSGNGRKTKSSRLSTFPSSLSAAGESVSTSLQASGSGMRRGLRQTWILMERNMINYSRNLLAYGVRLAMYLGMGVLLATVWVNLAQTSAKINDRLSVHFFSVAFLGFMSVAGIPAFLEERQVFIRERMDGLYGPGAYVLANSLCTLPYLFVCSLLFSVLCYWSIGLHPGATPFFRFLGILFLAVYTAESQSAVIAAILPIFVAALAIASFLNGFWMCVGGYFIKAVNLPRFWYFWAHFIDYQTYAFDLLVVNDFRGLTFDCTTEADGSCYCDFPSSLMAQGECKLLGDDVLNALDIGGINPGLYVGILLLIAVVFRVMLYVVLVYKKR